MSLVQFLSSESLSIKYVVNMAAVSTTSIKHKPLFSKMNDSFCTELQNDVFSAFPIQDIVLLNKLNLFSFSKNVLRLFRCISRF